jgi:hypothetical protein
VVVIEVDSAYCRCSSDCGCVGNPSVLETLGLIYCVVLHCHCGSHSSRAASGAAWPLYHGGVHFRSGVSLRRGLESFASSELEESFLFCCCALRRVCCFGDCAGV